MSLFTSSGVSLLVVCWPQFQSNFDTRSADFPYQLKMPSLKPYKAPLVRRSSVCPTPTPTRFGVIKFGLGDYYRRISGDGKYGSENLLDLEVV